MDLYILKRRSVVSACKKYLVSETLTLLVLIDVVVDEVFVALVEVEAIVELDCSVLERLVGVEGGDVDNVVGKIDSVIMEREVDVAGVVVVIGELDVVSIVVVVVEVDVVNNEVIGIVVVVVVVGAEIFPNVSNINVFLIC